MPATKEGGPKVGDGAKDGSQPEVDNGTIVFPYVTISAEPLPYTFSGKYGTGQTETIVCPQRTGFVYIFPSESDIRSEDTPLIPLSTVLDRLNVTWSWQPVSKEICQGRDQAYVVRKMDQEGQFVPFDFDKAVRTAVQIERVIKQLTDTDQIIKQAKKEIARIND